MEGNETMLQPAADQESPEYVRTSLAAAMSLGLKPGQFYRNAVLHGLNLLLTYKDGCDGRCTYCGLARDRKEVRHGGKTFIRVDWPTYTLDTILDRVKTYPHHLERVCVSMVTHARAVRDAVTVISRFKKETDLYISALIAPTLIWSKDQLVKIKEAGADMCGIAIDGATPEIFDANRGEAIKGPHRWDHFWEDLNMAVEVFGRGRVGVHLIVGLGETEEEMIRTIQRAQDLGAATHLFSFFPEAGSALEDREKPSLGQYRRVQLARYLINEGKSRAEAMTFNAAGQVVDFGCNTAQVITRGEAFMTSGCHGKTCKYACNRPYGNERPSEVIRNFPFTPEAEDIAGIRQQLREGLQEQNGGRIACR